jgi:hypothetical protein
MADHNKEVERMDTNFNFEDPRVLSKVVVALSRMLNKINNEMICLKNVRLCKLSATVKGLSDYVKQYLKASTGFADPENELTLLRAYSSKARFGFSSYLNQDFLRLLKKANIRKYTINDLLSVFSHLEGLCKSINQEIEHIRGQTSR